MSASKRHQAVSQGDQIFTKVSILIFLGVLLMGLGAERELWPSLYRAFFVWLAVSLIASGLRVLYKYHLYHQREQELASNLQHAQEEESRLLMARRDRKQKMNEVLGLMQGEEEANEPEGPTPLAGAIPRAKQAEA